MATREDAAPARSGRRTTLLAAVLVAALAATLVKVIYFTATTPPNHAKGIREARREIALISMALETYYADYDAYPPDTGYHVASPGGAYAYDPGALWRYLCSATTDASGRVRGPYLEWREDRLGVREDDPRGPCTVLRDPWGRPYDLRVERAIHLPTGFDLYSVGPDGVTASNNGSDDDNDGTLDDEDEWKMNGDVGDDIANW